MKPFYDEHDALRANLATLEKLANILNYPDDLTHAVRQGWPELRLLLRDVHSYFTNSLPRHHRDEEEILFPRLLPLLTPEEKELVHTVASEHRGLNALAGYFLDLTRGWLSALSPPRRAEVDRFSALASEISLHFERHIKIENERILPLAATLLSSADRKAIIDELTQRTAEETPAEPLKRSA